MTGFGRAAVAVATGEVTVEMQSVNRRNLETVVSLPRDWQGLERPISERIRQGLSRGRVQVNVQLQSTESTNALSWDDQAVLETLKRLEPLCFKVGVPWPPDADTLLKIVLLHKHESGILSESEAEPVVMRAVEQALQALERTRGEEGARLREDLGQRVAILASLREVVAKSSTGLLQAHREQLLARLRQAGLALDVADERVLKEVALFADRADVSEELTRLDSHLSQFAHDASEGGPVGRKLEFLLQEIHREFNTIGSKSSSLEVTRAVLEAKNEIERLREQLQNVE